MIISYCVFIELRGVIGGNGVDWWVMFSESQVRLTMRLLSSDVEQNAAGTIWETVTLETGTTLLEPT